MKQTEVSRATIGRIPLYLRYLKNKPHTAKNISATTLARELGLGEVQVRKDLGIVSGAGRPKTGYNIEALISALERFLSRDEENSVVIVGAGKLGRALLDYGGFKEIRPGDCSRFRYGGSGDRMDCSGQTDLCYGAF